MTIRNLRWWIAGLLLAIAVKNYVDRQALSLLAPTIQADLGISDVQYGNIVSVFLVAYALSYVLSGRLADAIGGRLSMMLFVGVWSLSSVLSGVAQSAAMLGTMRFLLGLGEAGGYTASAKVVSDWFPAKERGTASSLFSMGGSIGATIAPLLVVGLAGTHGWRSVFIASGLLGVALAGFWMLVYQHPSRHRWLSREEGERIRSGQESQVDAASGAAGLPAGEWGRWRWVLTSPAVWVLVGARMLTDPVWYFFQFWLPKYFNSVRGLGQAELGWLWVVFLAADVGFIAAGLSSDWLIRRGGKPARARKLVMLACAAFVPLAPLIVALPSTVAVFVVAMVVVCAEAAWMASVVAYVMDIVPKSLLGTAFGFIGAGSALGGVAMNQLVALSVSRFSYDYCFYGMAVLHPLAFLLVWRFAEGRSAGGRISA